jgi:Uma2 family endonuclease
MSAALEKPWTKKQFFAWAETQDGRYEFDGHRPVAMTGGTVNHAIIMRNLHRGLDSRLRGSACTALGPDAGLATTANKIRYPDALITCAKQVGTAKTVIGAVIVFEIASPGKAGTDRITKVEEYAAVPSILRYVIVESTTRGVLNLHRAPGEPNWRANALPKGGILALPEVGLEIGVAEFYEGVEFDEAEDALNQML